MHKVYIAGSMANTTQAQLLADLLEGCETSTGPIRVVSRWHSEGAPVNDHHAVTQQNTQDLLAATYLVFLGDVPSTTGGMWFDLGYFRHRRGVDNVLLVLPQDAPQAFLHGYHSVCLKDNKVDLAYLCKLVSLSIGRTITMTSTQVLRSIVDEAELRGFDTSDFQFLTRLNEHQAGILVGILKQKVSLYEDPSTGAVADTGSKCPRNKG